MTLDHDYKTGRLDGEGRSYRFFNLKVQSTLDFPGAWPPADGPAGTLHMLAQDLEPAKGDRVDGWQGVTDGERFVAVGLDRGDYAFSHGDRYLAHLSTDHRILRVSPTLQRDTRWWRTMLDSVSFTVSLASGHDALHAGAVATAAGAVAVTAGTGGGKSSLLAEMVREGYSLVSDDVLFITELDGEVAAHPGPPLMTLPRNRSEGVGHVIATIEEEHWCAVPVVREARPLRRIVRLNRGAGLTRAVRRLDRPAATLLRQLLKFPTSREREAGRFFLASEIAGAVEIIELSAGLEESPRTLAELSLAGLHRP